MKVGDLLRYRATGDRVVVRQCSEDGKIIRVRWLATYYETAPYLSGGDVNFSADAFQPIADDEAMLLRLAYPILCDYEG